MSTTTRRRSRRFTLDFTMLDGDSEGAITLADLRRFVDENEQYDPRIRSVTFELDDAELDYS
jgi:Ca2+-binding EF-hand superfamily protein